MRKIRVGLKIRSFISLVLVIIILLSTSTFRIFAAEGNFIQKDNLVATQSEEDFKIALR